MNGENVTRLVKELVQHVVYEGNNVSSPSNEKAVTLALEIVRSNIGAASSQDEESLVSDIKRRLVLEGGTGIGLTFTELIRRLGTAKFSSDATRRSILLLLLRVSKDRQRELQKIDSSRNLSPPAVPSYDNPIPAEQRNPIKTPGQERVSIFGRQKETSVNNHGGRNFGFPHAAVPLETSGVTARGTIRSDEDDGLVKESELVRDVLYNCQAIDGKFIKFDYKEQAYMLDEGFSTTKAIRTLLQQLCELGKLYREVHEHMKDSNQNSTGPIGIIGQAFIAALHQELGDYYRLMSVLEAQAQHPIPSRSRPLPSDGSTKSVTSYLTLLRLKVWLSEPLVRMRLLAAFVEKARHYHGGALAGELYEFTWHGNPLNQQLSKRILQGCCVPLLNMIRQWVLEGDLRDPFHEFFIVAEPNVNDDSLWEKGYRIEAQKVPSFISSELAACILRTGKSINFLQRCCKDRGWSAATASAVEVAACEDAQLSELEVLTALVKEACEQIDKHLIKVLFDRFNFMKHFDAIKRYLLHGQGDFIQLLVDFVGPELSAPASRISHYTLSSKLDMAIRGSLAQYDDPKIIECLKVAPMISSAGITGWDAFSLQYSLQPPLSTVFTDVAMEHYLRIFNLLWRVKRVEHALSDTWHSLSLSRPERCGGEVKRSSLLTSSTLISSGSEVGEGKQAPSDSGERQRRVWDRSGLGDAELANLLQQCEALRREMAHFVANMQIYVMIEVMEASWINFSAKAEDARGLDGLIEAHEQYLKAVVEKALLGEHSQLLRDKLYFLLSQILSFTQLVQNVQDEIRQLAARREARLAKAVNKEQSGEWGSTEIDGPEPSLPREFIVKASADVSSLAAQYSTCLEGFIAQLPAQQHVNLSYLSLRLDFSFYYARQHLASSNMPLKLRHMPPGT